VLLTLAAEAEEFTLQELQEQVAQVEGQAHQHQAAQAEILVQQTLAVQVQELVVELLHFYLVATEALELLCCATQTTKQI